MSKQIRTILIIFLPGLFLLFKTASAQDANYWTYQYGSRSTLLGGAVIGSVLDLSGTYYNPGAISLIKDPETVLAAKIFEYPNYNLEGTSINDVQLSSSSLGPAPSLVATMLKLDWLGNHSLVLSFLTRYDLRIDLAYSDARSINKDQLTNIITNLYLREKMSESWFGITWSHSFGAKIGIGATPYFVFRSHTTFGQSIVQTTSLQDEHFLALDSREYSYDQYSLLLKAGITFDFIGNTIGLTITTPRIGFYNNGSSGINNTIDGKNPFDEDENITYVAADYQKDVPANYKSPFSVAVGTTFKIDRTNVYVSAEWFSSVAKYSVISPRPFTVQIGSDTLYNGITGQANSVINVGVGFQHTFNGSFSLNTSITTDFSASNSDIENEISFASWDIYHLMLGGALNILNVEITMGLGYAFGSENIKKRIRIPSSAIYPSPVSYEGLNFSYQTYKLIIGFAF